MSGPLGPKERTGIWVIPVEGGPLRMLYDDAWLTALSPDGAQIAFIRRHDYPPSATIWLGDVRGEPARNIVSAPPGYSFIEALAWSPDGRRIAYGRRNEIGDDYIIESYDLSNGETSVVLADPQAGAFCWTRDGRIVYSRLEGALKESNLWDIPVDAQTARAHGKPRRLTNWSGFFFTSLSTSTDGRRLFFISMRYRSDIYVAQLEAESGRWTTPRRLTFEHWINRPTGWTVDSQDVLYSSDRNGDFDIFRQAANAPYLERAIVKDADEKWEPRLSTNGRWILYLAWPRVGGRVLAAEGRLMRVGVEGGSPQAVFRVAGYVGSARLDPDDRLTARGQTRFRCPVLTDLPCVLSEQVQSRVVFTAFDPIAGRRGKVGEVDVKEISFWDLSPDGRWIAFGRRDRAQGRIRLLSLVGEAPRELSAAGWTVLESVAWAADGKAVFVSGFASKGPPLLRVGLDGKVELLHRGNKYLESPVASPDGRYVAFAENTADSNAWVIDNFR